MKNCNFILIFLFIFLTSSFSNERSDIEIKNKVFPEDWIEFGEFEEIRIAPDGLFTNKQNQFVQMTKYSQEKLGLIFVTQKNLMDKYPENLMKGMAYFEFFYMQQLKENEKDIKKYIQNYPNVKNHIRKSVQKIYGLNKARKSMREALGFTLEDDLQDVLKSYVTLSKLFEKGEKITFKLNSDEKKIYNTHKKLTKYISKIKSLVEERDEQRINEKKFIKEFKKLDKKAKSQLKKITNIKNYETYSKLLNKISDISLENTELLLSSYKFSDYILSEIKKKEVTTRYKVDLSNADFSDFKEKELMVLAEASKSSKKSKIIKNNDVQKEIFYLENNNFKVNELIDEFNLNSLELSGLNLKLDEIDKINLWARNDWANAWRNPIPTKIEDVSKGIMIDLSEEDIKSIKAQLAIEHFKELFDKDFAKNFENDFQDALKDINQNSFKFSYGLDDYAQFLGTVFDMDIRNYADLTDLANATHNANWSVEEYASAYQTNVDFINALASGASSFDAAQVAQNLGASLPDVADTVAAASAAGVSVDLESAAQGLGYDSFASAVDAYNQQYGTNYTAEQAREALGQ